jgi:translation initiation factor IF-3
VHSLFLRILWRCYPIAAQDHLLNEDIKAPEVRLISETGEQLGLMSAEEALRIAVEKEMDLVMIAPGSKPPVCKIMDYGKYRFEQAKREKEAKKNQHVVEIKEIRMSPSIGIGDFNVKLKNAQKFLADGNRVKVSVRFKGREMAHTNIGEELLTRFAEECGEVGTMDKNPKLEGRFMSMFLSPKGSK